MLRPVSALAPGFEFVLPLEPADILSWTGHRHKAIISPTNKTATLPDSLVRVVLFTAPCSLFHSLFHGVFTGFHRRFDVSSLFG
jgi:hypothetical protein